MVTRNGKFVGEHGASVSLRRMGRVKVNAGRNGPRRRNDGRDYKRLKGKRQREKVRS
jgi:hypothetical protein